WLAVSVDPVTVGQFLALTKGEDLRAATGMSRRSGAAQDDCLPITQISRADCDVWLEKFNAALRQALGSNWPLYRLLNNSEWTYACTCGLHARHVIGDRGVRALDRSQAVFRYSDIEGGRRYGQQHNPRRPAPVQDPRNQLNYFGLRGMHGNI